MGIFIGGININNVGDVCRYIGSKDNNGNSKIDKKTEYESYHRLEEIFPGIDSDRDNIISISEELSALKSLIKVSEKDIEIASNIDRLDPKFEKDPALRLKAARDLESLTEKMTGTEISAIDSSLDPSYEPDIRVRDRIIHVIIGLGSNSKLAISETLETLRIALALNSQYPEIQQAVIDGAYVLGISTDKKNEVISFLQKALESEKIQEPVKENAIKVIKSLQ